MVDACLGIIADVGSGDELATATKKEAANDIISYSIVGTKKLRDIEYDLPLMLLVMLSNLLPKECRANWGREYNT